MPGVVYIVPVQGTGGWNGEDEQDGSQWWHKGSSFMRELARYGVHPARPDDPFFWTTRLNGVSSVAKYLFGWIPGVKSWTEKRDWIMGGMALRHYLDSLDSPQILTHSHGFQVVLYALAKYDGKVDKVLAIAPPLRPGDMQDVLRQALPKIGRLKVMVDKDGDFVAMLGRFGDNRLGSIKLPSNVEVEDIPGGHSGILRDTRLMPLWARRIAEFFRK